MGKLNESPRDPSYTIPEFCAAEGISIPTYYKWRDAGCGPREMRSPVGKTVRISPEARRDWHRERENPTGEQAEAINHNLEQLRAKGRAAAAKAIVSDKHPTNVRLAARAEREAARGRRQRGTEREVA